MFLKLFVILLVGSNSISAAFVDRVIKCFIKDEECLRTSFGNSLRILGESGSSELGIPVLDPYEFKNISISILNVFDFNLNDGRVKGLKDCAVDKMRIDLEKGRGIYKVTCNIVIEGKYNLDASSPIFKNVLGAESIHGDGNAKIEIEKLKLSYSLPAKIEKRESQVYLKYDFKRFSYEYKILGKVKISGDNLYIGKQESSKLILDFFNDNWQLIVSTFGNPVAEKALRIGFEFFSKFYDYVPLKYYISDDLSTYIKS